MKILTKRRTVKILKWLGIVTVVLAIGYAILASFANAALKRAYAALEADGRPIEFEDITPPAIPEPDNAALVYRSVVLQLKAEKAENGGEKNLWDALIEVQAEAEKQVNPDAPTPELVQRYLQLHSHPAVTEALADLEAGSRKSGYWNNLDFTKGIYLGLPHVSELKSLTEIICASARIRSAAGDPSGAWNSVLTALRVADALEHEPVLFSQVVRAAQFGTVMDAIQDLPYNAPTYADTDALLAAGENPVPWAAAMDGERIFFGEWAFRVVQSDRRMMISMVGSLFDGEARQSWMGVSLYLLIGPLSRFDHAAHIALTDGMAREMLEPYPVEGAAAIQQIQEDLPWYCVITKILAPEFRTIRTRQVELVAKIRVTRAGLAVLRQHDEQGAWPDVLPAELADLTDPFTGKPLIYQPSSTGFVLYSVGKNLTDDKGTAGKSGEGDIVWRYSVK